jgi:hypothetical protein
VTLAELSGEHYLLLFHPGHSHTSHPLQKIPQLERTCITEPCQTAWLESGTHSKSWAFSNLPPDQLQTPRSSHPRPQAGWLLSGQPVAIWECSSCVLVQSRASPGHRETRASGSERQCQGAKFNPHSELVGGNVHRAQAEKHITQKVTR